MSSPARIACALPASAFERRAAHIAELNRSALRTLVRGPRTVTLTYRAAAEPELLELVQLERECCAFLTIQLDQPREGSITLTVVAPDIEGADYLLAPFLTGTHEATPS